MKIGHERNMHAAVTGPRGRPSRIRKTAIRGLALAAILPVAAYIGWEENQNVVNSGETAAVEVSPGVTAAPEGRYERHQQAARHRDKVKSFTARELEHEIRRLLYLAGGGASPDEILQEAEAICQLLITAGESAVSDALEFLESGEDLPLAGRAGSDFDFQSLRLALIDTLQSIGGADVERVLFEQLQITDSPAEIEAISNALEALQPAVYRDAILDVALARLADIGTGQGPGHQVEAAPLFRVLQELGGEDIASVLQRLPGWFDAYAAVSLANLPGGGGIDRLLRAARHEAHRPGDNRPLLLLAQSAPQEPLAERALVELMREGAIRVEDWPLIADILIGDRQFQLQEPPSDPLLVGSLRGSNPFAVQTLFDRQVQRLYSVNYSAVLQEEEVSARLALIRRLLDTATDPAARAALWAAWDLLEAAY